MDIEKGSANKESKAGFQVYKTTVVHTYRYNVFISDLYYSSSSEQPKKTILLALYKTCTCTLYL